MGSFVLSALLLAGAFVPGALASGHIAPSIGVFIDFESQPSVATVTAMQREVGSIMKPTGLLFTWRDLNGDQPQGSFADLVVIHFKGACNGRFVPIDELGPWVGTDSVLASTQTANGQILHFTDVNCDEVRHYLAPETAHVRQQERDDLYGRALGRIVSHEMYHIFAATSKHAPDGVARAYFSRRELVQPVFSFERKENEELRDFRVRAFMADEADPEP
jgi:hypothetical protein